MSDELETTSGPAKASGAAVALSPILGRRYELLSLLGSGGMGTVYRARDRDLEEIVALKVLRREVARSVAALERFRREVKLARKVTHKNVARMFDIGNDRGERYLTMEYVEGDSLSTIARAGPLPAGDVLAIAMQLCDGLAASHEAGVLHLDLKPGNVLSTSAGRIVITDFGIARALTPDDEDRSPDDDGAVSGTPGYMSPEQVLGAADLDERTDVYALGCMLYRLLTGSPAWSGASAVAIAAARLLKPPPDPRLHTHVPDTLAEVVMRCMAQNREQRFASTREVAAALGGPLAERSWAPTSAAPASRRQRSVAVLPFENLGVEADAYLAEGFASELSDLLCRHAGLRVVPSRVQVDDARDAGRALGVEVVVHGSVVRREGLLELTLRVIAVTDGFQLLARTLYKPFDEILATAREAASSVIGILTTAVEGDGATRSRGTDPQAIDLYMQGRALYARSYFEVDRSTALLEKAYALAPADGRIGAAYALAMMRRFSMRGMDSAYLERARDVALEALAADRDGASGHAALAMFHVEQGELRSGGVAIRRALELDPMQMDALVTKGGVLADAGHSRRAIEVLRTVCTLDPSRELAVVLLARAYADLGDFDGAFEVLDLPVVDGGDTTLRWRARARLLGWSGDAARASAMLATLDADTRSPEEAKPLARSILRAVRDGKWNADDLALFVASFPQATTPRASAFRTQMTLELLAWHGDTARALALVPELARHEPLDVAWIDRCPLLDTLREKPEVQALRKSVAFRAARAVEGLEEGVTVRM